MIRRTAVSELGGKSLHGKFHMLSAADCDRQHKGYYRCAEPKYPRFCPTGDKSHEWWKCPENQKSMREKFLSLLNIYRENENKCNQAQF